MVDRARDAMIAISFLWVVFGFVVAGRVVARHRGIGLGLDDVLAVAAFVSASWGDAAVADGF